MSVSLLSHPCKHDAEIHDMFPVMRIIGITLLVALTMSGWAGSYQPAPGTNRVEIVRSAWHDDTRARILPVKITLPTSTQPAPVGQFAAKLVVPFLANLMPEGATHCVSAGSSSPCKAHSRSLPLAH
jgi:hypothetical protein